MDAERQESLLKVLHHQRLPTSILSRDLQPTTQQSESAARQCGDNNSSASRSLTLESALFTQMATLDDDIGAANATSQPLDTQQSRLNNISDPWTIFDIESEPTVESPQPQISCGLDSYDPELSNFPGLAWNTDDHQAEVDRSQSFSYPGHAPIFDTHVENLSSLSVLSDDAISSQAQGHRSVTSENVKAESDADKTENLVNELSERIGSLHIEASGRIRYYGPTSTFSLAPVTSPETLVVHRTMTPDSQDVLNRLGLDKPIPRALEEHLTKLYFTWQDPSLHIVHQQAFECARDRWQKKEHSPFYSESLQNAMSVESSPC